MEEFFNIFKQNTIQLFNFIFSKKMLFFVLAILSIWLLIYVFKQNLVLGIFYSIIDFIFLKSLFIYNFPEYVEREEFLDLEYKDKNQ